MSGGLLFGAVWSATAHNTIKQVDRILEQATLQSGVEGG